MAYFKKNWPVHLHADVLACTEEVVSQMAHAVNPCMLMHNKVQSPLLQTEQGNSSATAHCQEK
jgi:hypothetical protein